MKNLKISFLFFCFCNLILFSSCNEKLSVNQKKSDIINSLDIFILKMKDENFDYKTRLQSSRKALQLVNITKGSSDINEILSYKIYLFGNLKQYDSAIYTTRELLKKSIKENDSLSIGRNYSKMAYYYSRNSQNDSAYFYYNLLKNNFLKYNDSVSNGNNLYGMSIIELSIGDLIASEYSGALALNYYKGKNPNYSASVYNNWAISSKSQGQLQDAILYYKKAISLSTSKKNIIIYKNNLAIIYRDLKKYDTSIAILDSLKNIETLDKNTKARVEDNLAYIKWLADKNEYALPDLQNALAIRLEENDFYGSIASYAHLSEYYKNIDKKNSLHYALKMYEVATTQNRINDKLEALQKLITLDNPKNAKKYYNTYILINDSLQKAKDIEQNKFAKIRYQSDKNQKENLQLKIAQSNSKLELEKEKTRNIIGVVLSGSIIIGLLVFVYYRKQKHQREKREEVYKTETRIAKKIHDEVANNVINIMNKVQYTKETKDGLLDDLEKVYLLTRNISHQNNTIETGDKFENSLKALLTSYNNEKTTIILKNITKIGLEFIPKDKQVEIYRILQELMVNMQKHSKASLVAISFKNVGREYFINYSDNGVGLEFDNFTLKNGLKNVDTRIKSINGSITFDTSLNNGFKVFISFNR
jgi:signal transduction histidine kinase